MLLIATNTFLTVRTHADDDQQGDQGRLAIVSTPQCPRESPARSSPRPVSGHRGEPVTLHVGAIRLEVPLSIAPASEARGAHGACCCWRGRRRRSVHRRPTCGASSPAAPGSSTRWSRRRVCTTGRAAPRSQLVRSCWSATVSAAVSMARGAGTPSPPAFLLRLVTGCARPHRVRRGSILR